MSIVPDVRDGRNMPRNRDGVSTIARTATYVEYEPWPM